MARIAMYMVSPPRAVLQVFQLADDSGVVLLEVAVPDGVELPPQGAVGLVHLVVSVGRAHPHFQHGPLRARKAVQSPAQLVKLLFIVDFLQGRNLFVQSQDLEVVLPDALFHAGKADLSQGVRLIVRLRFRVRAGDGAFLAVRGVFLRRRLFRESGEAQRNRQRKSQQQGGNLFLHVCLLGSRCDNLSCIKDGVPSVLSGSEFQGLL